MLLGSLFVTCLVFNIQTPPEPGPSSVNPKAQAVRAQEEKKKGPFAPRLVGITPSRKGIFGDRFGENFGRFKYLDVGEPLEPEAAIARFVFPNRDYLTLSFIAAYTDDIFVQFHAFTDITSDETFAPDFKKFIESLPPTQRNTYSAAHPKEGSERGPGLPNPVVDVSIPSGYGPSLLKGQLLIGGGPDPVAFPLADLPIPHANDTDKLPAITHTGKKGKGVEVSLKRAILSKVELPDHESDPSGAREMIEDFQYTGAHFSTKADPAFAKGRNIDLVMRLKRTRWSDQPGKWFNIHVRDVLNNAYDGTDEYSFNVDPTDKMAEFECIPVETVVRTEKVVIHSVGKLTGVGSDKPEVHPALHLRAKTRTGWTVSLGEALFVKGDDHSSEVFLWEPTLTSPSGKVLKSVPGTGLDPLHNDDFVTDIQLSSQKTRKAFWYGEPCVGPEGSWKDGPLGDATLTVCHVERKVHPAITLRLPLLKGGNVDSSPPLRKR